MNSFIFYAEAQLIFTLFAKIVNSSGTRNVLGISFSCSMKDWRLIYIIFAKSEDKLYISNKK